MTFNNSKSSKRLANNLSSQYHVVDYFSRTGTITHNVNVSLYGLVEEVRINIFEQVKNWILIYEIAFF